MGTARRRSSSEPPAGGNPPDAQGLDRCFGAHMSIAGGHDRAVRSAAALGFRAVQVFTKSTNQWAARPLTETDLADWRCARAETGLERVVAHDSYLINLASPQDELWEKSIASLTTEVERAEALGIEDLVCHPGAHMGTGEDAGIRRVAEALRKVIAATPGSRVRIDLESTAGMGTTIGHRLEHLGAILQQVGEPARTGVCLDTCHLFAAGYPFGTEQEYSNLIELIVSALASFELRVWHLNDSVRELGARVDRHAGIGRGKIGSAAFRRIVCDPRFALVPMILETPKGQESGEELDAINLRILRDLCVRQPARVSARRPRGRRGSGEGGTV